MGTIRQTMEGAADFAKEISNVLRKPDGSAAGPEAIGGKILGLYFSAHWCPPCRAFTPQLADFYRNLKAQRDDFEIIFVSSDKTEEERAYSSSMPWLSIAFERRDLKGALGQAFGVNGIPTLVWLSATGQVITLEDRGKVLNEPESFPWAQPAKDAAAAAAGKVGKYSDLLSVVMKQQSTCLNADEDSAPLRDVLEGQGKISSDADEQLLINLEFSSVVKINSLRIAGAADGSAPRDCKIFVNRRALGFEDAEDLKPTERFSLTEAQATGKEPVQLNFVLYQKVLQLAIFVENNQADGEVTTISGLQLFGLSEGVSRDATIPRGE